MVEIQKKGTSILSPITSGGEHYETVPAGSGRC